MAILDKKITELSALVIPETPDELYVVDDVAGTPTQKSVTVGTLLNRNLTSDESTAGLTEANIDVRFESVDVRRYGTVGDGVVDDGAAIVNAHLVGSEVTYKNETYLFQSTTNPDISNGISFEENSSVVGLKSEDKEILVFDDSGLIGLQQNHLELDETEIGSNAVITQGVFVSPPVSKADIQSDIDIIAHWFMDWGSEFVRSGNGSNGNLRQYYWDWGHTDTTSVDGFRDDRRPLLGWYRGDESIVLDWQCYWLREYGVRVVSLVPSAKVDTSTWSTQADEFHWLFQLFNNTPNFQGLRYLFWGPFDGAGIQTQWEGNIDDIYAVFDNFYSVEIDGKLYPAMYCFEEDTLFTNLGGTDAAYKSFCEDIADKFIALGYAGVAMFMRHMKSEVSIDRRDYEEVNCFHFAMDYGAHGSRVASGSVIPVVDDSSTMSAMVASWEPYQDKPAWVISTGYVVGDIVTNRRGVYRCISNHTSAAADEPGHGKNATVEWARLVDYDKEIASVATSKFAVDTHPSDNMAFWKADGATPAIFRTWLNKAIDLIRRHDLPKIIAVYNVSEWAEGGASLQPNSQDRFGYLEAVRQVLAESGVSADPLIPSPDENRRVKFQFVTASSTIDGRYDEVILHTDGPRTLTSTPTIQDGLDGQTCLFRYENISGNQTVTLQDEGTLSGSGLDLKGDTLTLGVFDSRPLTFYVGQGWVEEKNNRFSEIVAATNVITAKESGKTFYLDLAGGFTSTLPAPAIDLKFTFIVSTAPTTAYIITTNSGANVLFGTFLDIVGELVYFSAQDTLNFVASTSLVGDSLTVESDGTNWYCTAFSGADGGITTSQT